MSFNLRELFWLMIAAGLAVGWWCDHRKMNYVNLSGEVLQHSRDLLEISIGSDDGLKVGHSVEIHRKGIQIEALVRKVAHDRAVVQVVNRIRVPRIEEGDAVIARVKL